MGSAGIAQLIVQFAYHFSSIALTERSIQCLENNQHELCDNIIICLRIVLFRQLGIAPFVLHY